jgi:hypothetical protein
VTNSPYVRSSLAQATLEQLSPLIRRTLIEQQGFREAFGLKTDAVITFGDTGISIQRSQIFKAIRKVLSDWSEAVITDMDGRDWKVSAKREEGEQLSIIVSSDKQRYILPDFIALSPERATRLSSLENAAIDLNLPKNVIDSWRNILSERGLEDEEVDQFQSEFRDTPIYVMRLIRAEIQKGQSSTSSLAPPSRRYYERLVGEYDESSSIGDYATGSGKSFLQGLSEWSPYEGFLFSLFLSSHSAVAAEINVDRLDDKDIFRAFEFLVERGDRISQLGAIEVGLRILPERPEIEPLLVRLVKQIRDDDVDGHTSGFKLLSALFVFVDGELSKNRHLSDVPPFYRRLASLAQAALIQREAAREQIEVDSFCKWAVSVRGEQFYFQSLVDMRLEPRWNPDLAAASQLKADFFGRLMISAKKFEKNITNSELRSLLLSTEAGSLLAMMEFPRPYFPGPLEGKEADPNTLPSELVETIEAQLRTEEVGSGSFVALVNSAQIFHVDKSQADLAAEALKIGKHRLANIQEKPHLLAILRGLAIVAAVSRGQALADELRILVRRYRRDPQHHLSMDEALTICLVASASRAEPKEWRDTTGDWLTELAFEDLNDAEGESLYSHLQCLFQSAPELWFTCGRADAALRAYLGI